METVDNDANIPLITTTTSFDRERNRRRLPCCANSRLAVIALQLFFGVAWGIAWIILYFTGSLSQLIKDPERQDQMQAAVDNISIVFGLGVLVSSVVIYGALLYNVYFVLVGMVYTIIECVLVMIFLTPLLVEHLNIYIAGCIIFVLAFIQPHSDFIEEYSNREPTGLGDDLRAADGELFINNNGFS